MVRRYIFRDDAPPAAWRLALADDGTFVFEETIYAGDDTVENRAAGRWHVSDGNLSLTATASETGWFPIGSEITLCPDDGGCLWRGRYQLRPDVDA